MKKSEAVKLLQSAAFKADGYEQFVEVHMNGERAEVSISSSRPYSIGGGPSLAAEEGLLVNVTGSTLAKAVAKLAKHPEYAKALARAEINRQALGHQKRGREVDRHDAAVDRAHVQALLEAIAAKKDA